MKIQHPHHTTSLSPFSPPIKSPHNPSTRASAGGPKHSTLTKTTVHSHHLLSFCSLNTIKEQHLNLYFTHLSAIHRPATPSPYTYNSYPPYFTSFGQLPTTLSAKQKPLTYSTLPNTLLTGQTISLMTFVPSPFQNSCHAHSLYYKKHSPTPNRRIISS